MLFRVGLLAGFAFTASAAEFRVAGHNFTLPDGFEIEQIAAPPLVERPMLAAFDDDGRLYVCDSAGVNARAPELMKNPPDVIRVLQDTNGDGVFDKSSVFADKLVFPQGVLWFDGSVYVSSPPNFLRLRDTNGDGVADERQIIATGFPNTGCADDMHGANLGPDGRIYWFTGRMQHEVRDMNGALIHKGTTPVMFRCKPDGSDMEMVSGVLGNAVGVSFTPEGDGFVSGTFMAPDSMGPGLRDGLIHVVDGGEYSVRDRNPNELKKTGELLPPLTHHGASATSDNCIYRGTTFGSHYAGNVFACLFNMRRVVRHILTADGATFKCRNEDFLVSDNFDFHPTDVLEDADGSLLVIDTGGWFRICCPTSQIAKPEVKGAIYRIRRKGAPRPNDPRGRQFKWAALSGLEQTRLLDDPRFVVRDRAIYELAKRGESSVPVLRKVLTGVGKTLASGQTQRSLSPHSGPLPKESGRFIGARKSLNRSGKEPAQGSILPLPTGEGRGEGTENIKQPAMNALWCLARIDTDAAREAVRLGLSSHSPGVRQVAARIAGLHRDAKAVPRLSELVIRDAAPVRREVATALGRIEQAAAVPALLEALQTPADRFLEHALIFALIQISNREATLKGVQAENPSVRRGALIALDQMEGGNLTPDLVVPLSRSSDSNLRETALWIMSHRPDWATEIRGFLREELANKTLAEPRRGGVKKQLLAFAKSQAVQELMAETLLDAATPAPIRLVLLEAMAGAPVSKLPNVWTDALERSLGSPDNGVVQQAVRTVRSVPTGRRPTLKRIDAQINFPESTGPFSGTQLSEKFAARWTGLIKVPQAGHYTFFTESNDGSRLLIDGKMVLDNGGSHAMAEKSGETELSAGEHDIQVDYFQNTGGAGCVLSWQFDGRKEIIPPRALGHRSTKKAPALEPGLLGEYFEIGREMSDFPDTQYADFQAALLRVAHDLKKSDQLRIQALAGVPEALENVDSNLFDFLMASLNPGEPPLHRITAATTLGQAKLSKAQLERLTGVLAQAGPLELPKLLNAYAECRDEGLGKIVLLSLGQSKGLSSLKSAQLKSGVGKFPASIQAELEPLLKQLEVDAERQKSRLADLESGLSSGDHLRGSHLFNSPKTACSTCHRIGYLGGEVGPNLGRIGAIRSERDLLEAIVFPSASFARGYETMMISMRDGEEYAGVISRETPDTITLVLGANNELRLSRADIKDIRPGTLSLMPQGLDQQLSRQELADLVAFLKSLK